MKTHEQQDMFERIDENAREKLLRIRLQSAADTKEHLEQASQPLASRTRLFPNLQTNQFAILGIGRCLTGRDQGARVVRIAPSYYGDWSYIPEPCAESASEKALRVVKVATDCITVCYNWRNNQLEVELDCFDHYWNDDHWLSLAEYLSFLKSDAFQTAHLEKTSTIDRETSTILDMNALIAGKEPNIPLDIQMRLRSFRELKF